MYQITVTGDFSGAHNLNNYKGKCEELHGHNWKVEVTIKSRALNSQGMVIDFKIVKENLESILSCMDHKYLNKLLYFKKKNPTSENIARFIHDELTKKIKKKIEVTVWETDTSRASFYK